MQKLKGILLVAAGATLSAAVPAAAVTAMSGELRLFTLSFAVALAHSVLLGLPLYGLLRSRGFLTSWWVAVGGGGIVGVLPFGCLALLSLPDQASTDGTPTVINGVRTMAGWLEFFQLLGELAALGALGGLTFWLIIRLHTALLSTSANVAVVPQRVLGWRSITALASAAGIVACAAAAIPALTEDRSCHNPLRGRSSISSQINLELHLGMRDWRAVDAEMREFAKKRGWSYQGDVRPDPNFPWLQVSICDARGTEFVAIATDAREPIRVAVYQPQGGLDWREPFSAFYRRLQARWPGKLDFTGDVSQAVPPPPWLSDKRPVKVN